MAAAILVNVFQESTPMHLHKWLLLDQRCKHVLTHMFRVANLCSLSSHVKNNHDIQNEIVLAEDNVTDVNVGNILRICCSSRATTSSSAFEKVMQQVQEVHINVSKHTKHEDIDVRATLLKNASSLHSSFSPASPVSSAIRPLLHFSGGTYSILLEDCFQHHTCFQHPILSISAFIPERFMSVNIDMSSLSNNTPSVVRVERVKEASCQVEINQGSVHIGSVHGNVAIRTNGGCVHGNLIQANGKIESNGGEIKIKKVQAQSMDIRSEGGDIELGPSFAGEMHVNSAGGNINIASINASTVGTIQSGRGSISSGLLDGIIRIESNDGSVDFNVAESATSVECISASANITAVLATQSHVQLDCISTEDVILDDGMVIEEYSSNNEAASVKVSKSRTIGTNNDVCDSSSLRHLRGLLKAVDESGGWKGRIGVTEFTEDGSRRLRTVKLNLRSGGPIHLRRGSWIDLWRASLNI